MGAGCKIEGRLMIWVGKGGEQGKRFELLYGTKEVDEGGREGTLGKKGNGMLGVCVCV